MHPEVNVGSKISSPARLRKAKSNFTGGTRANLRNQPKGSWEISGRPGMDRRWEKKGEGGGGGGGFGLIVLPLNTL